MNHALEDHKGTICIGGRTITNLRFTDEELASLVQKLDAASAKFGMQISAEKTKLMTNNKTIHRDIDVQGQRLETVTQFKYLGAIISDEGSKP